MPTIEAPTYYDRSKGIMPSRFDRFFKWLIGEFDPELETGTTESPLGWVCMVEVTDADIVNWYESEGMSLEEMGKHLGLDEYPVDAGFYLLRQDDNGLIWAMTYGSGTLAEESARADFAEAEKVDEAWQRACDQEYDEPHPVCDPLCAPDCEERINCPDAGKSGHWFCGWCDEHDRPVHKCGHIHPEAKA